MFSYIRVMEYKWLLPMKRKTKQCVNIKLLYCHNETEKDKFEESKVWKIMMELVTCYGNGIDPKGMSGKMFPVEAAEWLFP